MENIISKLTTTLRIFTIGMMCTTAFNQADAATDANTKIAVVETRKVIETSTAHQNILSKNLKKNDEYRDSVQKEEAKLKEKYKNLEGKKNALSAEALEKKNEEMGAEVAELQKTSYKQHAALEDAYRNATQDLMDKTSDIIKAQAEKNHYNIVLEKGAAPYSDESLEITQTIIDQLNKETPTVTVTFDNSEKTKPAAVDSKKPAKDTKK